MLTWCPAGRMVMGSVGDRVRLMVAGSDGALDQDLVALLLREMQCSDRAEVRLCCRRAGGKHRLSGLGIYDAAVGQRVVVGEPWIPTSSGCSCCGRGRIHQQICCCCCFVLMVSYRSDWRRFDQPAPAARQVMRCCVYVVLNGDSDVVFVWCS